VCRSARVSFGEWEVLFKDKDVISSFALNPLDPSYIVVATSRGIKEFHFTGEHHELAYDCDWLLECVC